MPPDKVDLIIDDFRERILKGEFGTAGRLPSLRMLAEQFSTTHETMNKVIQRLQAEGLLISQRQAGVFINSSRQRVSGITQRFDLFLKKHGLEPMEIDIVMPSVVYATGEVAAALDVVEGTPVVRRFRLQGTQTAPYRLAENFYPEELAGGEILEGMQQDVHFDALEAIRKIHHKVIRRVHEDVFSRLETPSEMELLKIVRNTPVLEILRTSYAADDDSKAIMYSKIIFVATYCMLSYDYRTDYWT